MSNLTLSAFFTRGTGIPATGLTLADIDLYLTSQNIETGVDAVIWNGAQNPTEEMDNIGAYIRIYDSADFDTYNYFGRATYTGSVALDVDHVQGGIGPVNPWELSPRTLTQSAASVASAVSGEEVTTYRGTFWDVTLTGLPDLSDRTDVYLAIKENQDDSDDDAIVLWSLSTGLERLNGAVATASDGALTVPVGDTSVNVTLKASAAATLDIQRGYYYGIKRIASSDGEAHATSEGGRWDVEADTPRAVT